MIKKIAFSLVLCCSFFTLQLAAQENSSEIGIKVGLTSANMHNNTSQGLGEFDMVSARHFHAGLFWNKYFNKNWGFGLELLYNPKGGRSADDFNSVGTIDYRFRFDYVSLPVLCKFRARNFILEAGPEFSYKNNVAVIGGAGGSYTGPAANEFWNTDFDVALVGGVAYQIKRFIVGLRYGQGLFNQTDATFTDANGEPLSDVVVKHRALQISLGYAIIATEKN